MANNRLWLVHPATGKKFLLGKKFGNGWVVWEKGEVSLRDRLTLFFDDLPVEENFNDKATTLRVVDEVGCWDVLHRPRSRDGD